MLLIEQARMGGLIVTELVVRIFQNCPSSIHLYVPSGFPGYLFPCFVEAFISSQCTVQSAPTSSAFCAPASSAFYLLYCLLIASHIPSLTHIPNPAVADSQNKTMAKRSSPVASLRSGIRTYFTPASPSDSVPASPSHLEPKDGLAGLTYSSAVRNRVLIGKDANKDPDETCLVWAFRNNLIKPGDSVTILGILHRINNPMGYKSQANLSAFVGTNKVALAAEMSEKLVCFENSFRALADLCDSRGVYLDITITAGTPLKSVLVKEAMKMKVTHVLLDRHLRRDKRYYKEHLQCDVIAFSEKYDAESVRESSISYMFDNSGPLLPRSKSEASTVPGSPISAATSYTFDNNSFRSSDASTCKGESRASRQSSMGRTEDMSLRCVPEVKSNDKTMSEDLAEPSEESEEHSMASSAPNSRDNSFIDLFMLSSPDGITPVWSSVNENEICPSSRQVNSAEQTELISLPTKVTASSVADGVREKCSTDSVFSTSYTLDQQSSVMPQKDIVSVQPRRHYPQLSELIRAHEGRLGESDVCKNGAEDRLEDTPVPAPYKGEEVELLQESISNVVVDDLKEKHIPYKLFNQREDKECGLRKHFTQAPPLCSICKITSLELGRSPRVYDWLELKAATDDFAAENLIAEGGFSFVYKGTLPEGQTVAIKKLKALSNQGDLQFATEVEALSCAQHRNLVRLLGYGVGSNECALVYEYVCNGSLDQHLSGRIGGLLEWASRYKIAVGAARGLRYLHEECRVGCIVHRDVRPNNIFITHDFVPMVGDFGLAKLHTNVDAAIETQVVGALGYLAPEYVECGQVTSKTDVYSFGVVLLELISGRKAIDLQQPKGEISLVEWARQKLQYHQTNELVDQKVADSMDMFEFNRMLKVASLCIQRDPHARPGMSQVLQILEGDTYQSLIENKENCPSSSTKAGYKSHNLEDLQQSVDRLQTPYSTGKKVSAASKSWRHWVKST